jgi:SAM-dependent methyltransferase
MCVVASVTGAVIPAMLDDAARLLSSPRVAVQPGIDVANADFWDELCGGNLAREVGITDASPASLERFDRAYFDLYPYLAGYLRAPEMAGRRVLEVGLGYGTVAEALARGGADYHGLDIADGPVEMARHRLAGVPGAEPAQVQQGSVLELPFADGFFDRVVSIGCLHHTGNLGRAVAEVRRVLRPGGELLMMVYNRHSARRVLLWPLLAARHRLVADAPTPEAWLRYASDGTPAGDAPPHSDFVSAAELRGLLYGMRDVRIDRRSIDRVPLGPLEISRARLMRLGLDRLVGLDLYATARA